MIYHRLLFLLLLTSYISGGGAVSRSTVSPSPALAPADLVDLTVFVKAAIVVCSVFIIAIFSFYLNFWTALIFAGITNSGAGAGEVAGAGGNHEGGVNFQCSCSRGIDQKILDTFPIMVYSSIKKHMIGKVKVECAVCLSEFEDDESVRLMPKCDHVFHRECIDMWLGCHVSCPVCRADLRLDSGEVVIRVEGEGGVVV